jgi:hypothetical protein
MSKYQRIYEVIFVTCNKFSYAYNILLITDLCLIFISSNFEGLELDLNNILYGSTREAGSLRKFIDAMSTANGDVDPKSSLIEVREFIEVTAGRILREYTPVLLKYTRSSYVPQPLSDYVYIMVERVVFHSLFSQVTFSL